MGRDTFHGPDCSKSCPAWSLISSVQPWNAALTISNWSAAIKPHLFTEGDKFILKEVSGQFPNEDLTAPLWWRAIPAWWWSPIFPLPIFLPWRRRKERFSYQLLNMDQTNPVSGKDPWGRHPPSLQLLVGSAGITQCPAAKDGILQKSKCRQSVTAWKMEILLALAGGWAMEHLQNL